MNLVLLDIDTISYFFRNNIGVTKSEGGRAQTESGSCPVNYAILCKKSLHIGQENKYAGRCVDRDGRHGHVHFRRLCECFRETFRH